MLTFVSNKEVRIIPKGWSHPRDERGRHRPLLPADRWPSTPEEQRQWMAEYETAEPPNPDQFMPSVRGLPAEATEIVAYETTSEGTPISPAFPNTPQGRLDLVNYCAEHGTTFAQHTAGPEAWAAILFADRTTVVSEDGTVHAE